MGEDYVIAAGDYAAIQLGDTSLYYGYEVTIGTEDEDEDDSAEDWCFQAKAAGRVVTIPGAEIRSRFGIDDRERTEMMLLGGIALLLERGALQWKP